MKNINFKKISAITENLYKYSQKEIKDILNEFGTSLDGITDEEAAERLEKYGENVITYEKDTPWFVYLAKSFVDPFILVLAIIAFVSFITDVLFAKPGQKNWITLFIILTMIIISATLRFIQEYKSAIESDKLKQAVNTTTAIVRKDKGKRETYITEVVPGDIIHLAAGDMVPADMRIISCKDLFISQSALTGESEPVEKYVSPIKNINKGIADLDNICLMGTNVISGTAVAVVLSTGNDTYFGSMSKSLVGQRGKTSFERGVNSVSLLLIKFMLIMVPIVFLINGITKGDWLQAFLFSVSIAVGLTPEMLPTIVTTNLSKGAISLSKHKIIVKRLNSIQNFGAMDVLCTDKTGTLTLDKIVLEKHLDVSGNENDRVLRHAYLNSYYQTGLKNLMDLAVIEYGDKLGFNNLINKYKKIDEIPFDFVRRRMSVVVISENNKRQLVTKGAIEEMLSVCTLVELDKKVVPLTDEIKIKVSKMVSDLNKDGMRVLAIAQKNDIPDENNFSVQDEKNMVLMGYIGFLDPPKDSASAAINALQYNGVRIKILTGDNEIVTRKICKDVGIPAENIKLGIDIDKMSDEELSKEAESTDVFAKLSPIQKSKIINILQKNGHVVGYMGDGINDAAALKESDVGISVDTGVDIAKESADIILLQKDLMVLEQGVLEGRRVFGNIIKYIKMATSSNFGNVFSVLIASAFLPFLPMLPIQLLVQNLLYSISQLSIPWDSMDEEYLKVPREWNANDIGKFMIRIGPISSIFDIVTFIIMWYVFKTNSVESQSLFQSGWFIEGLLSQTLIVHMIRTKKIPFIQSRATKPVLTLTIIIMIIGISIPFTTFGNYIEFVPLPLKYFLWLGIILLSYCISIQIAKNIYIKKFNSWL